MAVDFGINARPLITHEIGTLFVPRHIPNDYLVVKSHLQSHKGFYRSLWIPRESRWTYYDDEHPSMSLAFILPSSYLSSAKDNLSNFILSNNFEEFINISSTRYIFIPLEDSRNDDNFYVYYDSRKKIAKKLDSLAYFKKRIIEVQKHIPSVTDLKVNGKDVMEVLKLGPGPKVGEILEILFEEIIEDPDKNDRERLLARIIELSKISPKTPPKETK